MFAKTNVLGAQCGPLHRSRARLTAGTPAVWHLTRRVVPYGAQTPGLSTSGRDEQPPQRSSAAQSQPPATGLWGLGRAAGGDRYIDLGPT